MPAADAITGRVLGPTRQIGRYGLYDDIGPIGAGGMATVHLARLAGPVGFSRVVAVKRLHPHLSADPQFQSMFIDEARLAARVRHANVVPILDVVVSGSELFLVMEYVQGEALSSLRRAARSRRRPIPPGVCSAIVVGALRGLHAAHEACDEGGQPLNLVHRDVSPPNILVGVDGIPMVLDFGVAKAIQGLHQSRPGVLKGKASYMAPEQIRGEAVGRSTDTFAAAIVLWELLVGRRLFPGATEHERMYRILHGTGVVAPSTLAPEVPACVDEIVLRGLRLDPTDRYQTALEMADALERALLPASQRTVGDWVAETAAETLARRAETFKRIETTGIPQDLAVVESGSVSVETEALPARGGGVKLALAVAAVAAGLLLGIFGSGGRRPRPPAPPPAAVRGPVLEPIGSAPLESLPAALLAPDLEPARPASAGTVRDGRRVRRLRVKLVRARAAAPRAPDAPDAPAPAPEETPSPAPAGQARPRVPLVEDPARLKLVD